MHDKGGSTKYCYAVCLSDDEQMIYLDILEELVGKADIHEGDYDKAVGVVTTKFDQCTA